VQAQLGRQFPKTDAGAIPSAVEPLKETHHRDSRRSLWLLFGSVTLLLFIASTNMWLALVSLGPASARNLRPLLLGCSSRRTHRSTADRNFFLALIGSGLGLFLAAAASDIFRSLAAQLPRVEEIHLDFRIVLYSLACSVVVTLLCGLVPAFAARAAIYRPRLRNPALAKSRTKSAAVACSSAFRWPWRHLLAAPACFFAAFSNSAVSARFDASHILTFELSMNWGETGDMKKLRQFTDRILETRARRPAPKPRLSPSAFPEFLRYQTNSSLSKAAPTRRTKSSPRTASSPRATSPLCASAACRRSLPRNRRPASVVVNRSFADAYFPGSPPSAIVCKP